MVQRLSDWFEGSIPNRKNFFSPAAGSSRQLPDNWSKQALWSNCAPCRMKKKLRLICNFSLIGSGDQIFNKIRILNGSYIYNFYIHTTYNLYKSWRITRFFYLFLCEFLIQSNPIPVCEDEVLGQAVRG